MQPDAPGPLPPNDLGWLPYNIRYDGAKLVVDWVNLADNQLQEPFFDQTIHRLLRLAPGAMRSTPAQAWPDVHPGWVPRRPTGFIFHMSRCGSTLVAQMLAALRECVVFSEPGILETLLRNKYLPDGASSEQQRWLFEHVIQAFLEYQQHRRGAFIKFPARAILDYPLITQTFPSVPAVFVYREPVEVLVALVGSQPDRLPPGLEKAGLLSDDPQAIGRMRPAEFWARVVANECAAALEMCKGSQPRLVNYNQLPEIVWTDLARFFGLVLSSVDVERMQARLSQNAKAPHQGFSADGAHKRFAATREIHTLVDRFVRPYYDRLETLRIAAAGHADGTPA